MRVCEEPRPLCTDPRTQLTQWLARAEYLQGQLKDSDNFSVLHDRLEATVHNLKVAYNFSNGSRVPVPEAAKEHCTKVSLDFFDILTAANKIYTAVQYRSYKAGGRAKSQWKKTYAKKRKITAAPAPVKNKYIPKDRDATKLKHAACDMVILFNWFQHMGVVPPAHPEDLHPDFKSDSSNESMRCEEDGGLSEATST